jgi:hypothetical protein
MLCVFFSSLEERPRSLYIAERAPALGSLHDLLNPFMIFRFPPSPATSPPSTLRLRRQHHHPGRKHHHSFPSSHFAASVHADRVFTPVDAVTETIDAESPNEHHLRLILPMPSVLSQLRRPEMSRDDHGRLTCIQLPS